ncbi:glycosidase [Sphingomonas crocodyli]|uniref:Glycosidase n=1 Tax=Sphingomonas crocodyli TaxID=1979270 RepID=A0A437LYU9_9SPHN|nr:glycosidase [Sphingomonas crocodyli]
MVRPFHIPFDPDNPSKGRVGRIIEQVLALDERAAERELEAVLRDFEARHWQTRSVFNQRYDQIAHALALNGGISPIKHQLIGAYFCHEYSYAAAALMNPSIVRHPDQSGLSKGSQRIIMSLRAVGEGHISSIAFREGILSPGSLFALAPEPPFATAAMLRGHTQPVGEIIEIHRDKDSTISGTLIFPITSAQSNGLEDLRLLEFDHDDGRREWIGTYTAYDGRHIRSEFLRTEDFRSFRMQPIRGSAGRNKGMALFPRKISGQYMMIGRQDGENLFLIKSGEIDEWSEGELLLAPKYPWELVQIGNCGAPIELDEGWLVLTHGVGAMRKYSIGAILLDKDDPSRIIGRTVHPLLTAADEDREGYVPNVVYTCGAIRHGDLLFMPYGVADSSVAFCFVPIASLLKAMS